MEFLFKNFSPPLLSLVQTWLSRWYIPIIMSLFMPCPSIALNFWSPKWICTVQIILFEYKSFWSGPNRFGLVQSILVRVRLEFSGLLFIIWTYCPKWFGIDQNKLHQSKIYRRTRHSLLKEGILWNDLFTPCFQAKWIPNFLSNQIKVVYDKKRRHLKYVVIDQKVRDSLFSLRKNMWWAAQ